jgi:hypothetical protein
MQKRSLRASPDQSGCGLHSQLQPSKFSRLLFQVSSNSPQGIRSNQDILHHSVWCILLYSYALRTEKHRCNLPAGYTTVSAFTAWRNAEAYVDDVVVKTREDEGLINELVETFDNMRKIKMKLNPEKCTFGVPSEKLLRYTVCRRGIDPNPEKVSAITKMKPLESLHDVQKLTGCMAALSRFIS